MIPYTLIARVGVLALFIFILSVLKWPDITSYLVFIPLVINKLYLLNTIIDMDTFFIITKLTLSIIVIILAFRIIKALVQFVSSGSFSGNQIDTSDDEE